MANDKAKTWWSSLNKFDKKYGQDYSEAYTENHGAELYILKDNSLNMAQMVMFKPFIKDISYNFTIKTKDSGGNRNTGDPEQDIVGTSADLKLSLILPAVSLSEARLNAKKVDFFMRLLSVDSSVILSDDRVSKELEEGKGSGSEEKKEQERNNEKPKEGNLNPDGTRSEPPPSGGGDYDDDEVNDDSDKAINSIINPDIQGGVGDADGDYSHMDATPNAAGRIAQEGKVVNNYRSYTGGNNEFYILCANLINSGHYTKKIKIFDSDEEKTVENMRKYGLKGSISDISADVDVELGFFEDKQGFLWPKAYTIGFSLRIANCIGEMGERAVNIMGFDEDGGDQYRVDDNYYKHDVKSWPFGITDGMSEIAKAKMGSDYSQGYVDTIGANIEISKKGHSVKYKPYLKSFKISRKIDKKNTQESESLHSHNVLVFDAKKPAFDLSYGVASTSVNEAILNQYKFQKLVRMMWASKKDHSTNRAQMYVSFANLIHSNTILGVGQKNKSEKGLRVVCKKISIKPDINMGFFDNEGLLFIKSYDISLNLETLGSDITVHV